MPNKTESIFLVGVITGLVGVLASFIPAAGDIVGCLASIGAGMLVVWHYVDKHSVTLSSGQGIGLGVLTCLVAGVTGFALDFLLRTTGIKPSMQEEIRQQIEQGGTDMAQLGAFGEFMMSPAYAFVAFGSVLVISALLGLIGGLIGSKMFKADDAGGPEEAGPADLI